MGLKQRTGKGIKMTRVKPEHNKELRELTNNFAEYLYARESNVIDMWTIRKFAEDCYAVGFRYSKNGKGDER